MKQLIQLIEQFSVVYERIRLKFLLMQNIRILSIQMVISLSPPQVELFNTKMLETMQWWL